MASRRTRGSAASKLLKGMPEDEMPPEESSPAQDEMPTQEPPSAPQVAGGPLEGLAEGAEGMPPGGPEEAAPMPPDDGGGAPMDLDAALAGVEASLQGMPEDAAREIRTHLEAIKDIASQQPEAKDQQMPGPEPSQDIPSPESGEPGAAPGMEEKL